MPPIVYQNATGLIQSIQSMLQQISVAANNNQFTIQQGNNQGDALSATQLAITDFLASVQSSNAAVNNVQIVPGYTNPSVTYNNFWMGVQNDLNNIYAGAANLGNILQDQNNYVSADMQNIMLQLKNISLMVDNYELFATSSLPNESLFTDNYTTTNQLSLNSSLLSDQQCNINTIEGAVTLAISNTVTADNTTINSITFGSQSNGAIIGSTQISDILNSTSLQQLFQYILTNSEPVTQALVLDFTIQLANPQIINYIRIVPNNYGTLNWPTITALDASLNGINSTSIKSLLLGTGTSANSFQLAPYSSDYAGEGRYSFLPIQAQSIHFTIQQNSPYFDATTNLYTWAIGIKDIEISSNQYDSTSQLVSSSFLVPTGISEIALNTNIMPDSLYTSTELPSQASALFDISVDGGMNWFPIAPQFFSQQDPAVLPILNINNIASQTNTSAINSINTANNATSFIYRIRMRQSNPNLTTSSLMPYYSPVVNSITITVVQQENLS